MASPPPAAAAAAAAFIAEDFVTLNGSANVTNTTIPDPIEHPVVQAFFCILYTTIFVLGVFGNVLVCYVVGRNKAMQTVTNFFITNLALSDILLCVLAVPFTPLYSFLGRWIFGQLLCHLVTYAQGTSVYISTLTLTAIAIDRYFVIIRPFKPRMKLSVCMTIIVNIWLFSLLVTLPYGYYMKFEEDFCEEIWPSENFRKIYGGLTSTCQFLVPFIVIAFCYVRVSLKLSDRARFKPGCKSSRKEEADRERKRRTNRMLIAMVAIFGLSWLPLNLINLLNDISKTTGDWQYYNLFFFVVHAVAMSSTCYNPFLYAWLNDNFRKEFKQVLPCFERSAGPATVWRSEVSCNGGGGAVGGGTRGGARGGRGAGGGARNALLRREEHPPTSNPKKGSSCPSTATTTTTTTTTMTTGTANDSPENGLTVKVGHQPPRRESSPSSSSWTDLGRTINEPTASYSTCAGAVQFHRQDDGEPPLRPTVAPSVSPLDLLPLMARPQPLPLLDKEALLVAVADSDLLLLNQDDPDSAGAPLTTATASA